MDIQNFLDNVHDLTDLELAVLLSLIAQQHCLITTDEDLINDLSSELALIASEIYKLSYTVVSVEDQQSVEKFGEAILNQTPQHDFGGNNPSSDDFLAPHSRLASVHVRAASFAPSHASQLNIDSRTVANVVIAKNFNHASRDVQIAALELITRRRIYSRTTVHQVPKTFLFVPIVSTETRETRLNDHLNDRISISHHHDADDGFANLEEIESHTAVSQDSSSEHENQLDYRYSKSEASNQALSGRHIDHKIIETLREMGKAATMTPEIRRYIQDVVVFLRMSRGVDGGVTPFATMQLVNLAKYLAPLHSIDFVTPSLVALAVRKVYPHRIVIADPCRERSTQWGSRLEDVAVVLKGLTSESVIETVLEDVTCPV